MNFLFRVIYIIVKTYSKLILKPGKHLLTKHLIEKPVIVLQMSSLLTKHFRNLNIILNKTKFFLNKICFL